MVVISPGASWAQQAPINCKGPLSQEQLIGLLQGGVADVRVQAFVKTCGIGFTFTPDVAARLGRAGASDAVIVVVREKNNERQRHKDNVSGKWIAQVPGRQGTIENTFNFKLERTELTGTVSSPSGERQISNGSINGNDIAFIVTVSFSESEFKLLYKGKISGDEIRFTREVLGGPGGLGGGQGGNGGRSQEFTAKKAK
jgi:hypothetical protein